MARDAGARVAVINMDAEGLGSAGGLGKDDWLFVGDAGAILEEILSPHSGEEGKLEEGLKVWHSVQGSHSLYDS